MTGRASFSLGRGRGSPESHLRSQWLQTTLSELDEKTKGMLELIEEDGSSLAQKAVVCYNRRPKLIRMVEEFNRSYRSLAEKYDKLTSEITHAPNSLSSSSPDPTKFQHIETGGGGSFDDLKLEGNDSHPESAVEHPDIDCDQANFNFETSNKLADILKLTEPRNMDKPTNFSNKEDFMQRLNGFEVGLKADGSFSPGSSKQENTWSELRFQVMKLLEENLQQQSELMRRNDEKRKAIKELQFQLGRLMGENRALQNCLGCSKVDVKRSQSQISRLKGIVPGKFFRGGFP